MDIYLVYILAEAFVARNVAVAVIEVLYKSGIGLLIGNWGCVKYWHILFLLFISVSLLLVLSYAAIFMISRLYSLRMRFFDLYELLKGTDCPPFIGILPCF